MSAKLDKRDALRYRWLRKGVDNRPFIVLDAWSQFSDIAEEDFLTEKKLDKWIDEHILLKEEL